MILGLALFLDYWIGDPQNWLHPVQIIGWNIQQLTRFFFQHLKNPLLLKLSGVLLAFLIIFGSAGFSWMMIQGVQYLLAKLSLPTLLETSGNISFASVLLASCFAGKSLRQAAEAILQGLTQDNLVQVRQQLSRYVGRDTDNLSVSEILRAILETVTENATDGVLAPLFYAMVGLALPGIGSVPLAFAYKAASTLDSMVGYREAPYTDIGWFSARLEDVLTWVPCRLVVLTIGLLSGKPGKVWRVCQRDAIYDPSPNAGWSECAYAVALGIQLGGMNTYQGVVKSKPLLGNPARSITPEVIAQALQLTRYSIFLWVAMVTLSRWL